MAAKSRLALMLFALLIAVRANAAGPITLTIRLYNTSGIPAEELISARQTTDFILRDAGLRVVFRHCGQAVSPDIPVDKCDEPLKPSEMVVRVINAPTFDASLSPDAYGVAYVVRETNRGWLATVFSDRIDEAATRVGIDPGELLGRVTAHELGHLLLGDGHAQAGVMLAEWPDTVLTETTDRWHFSMFESDRIQQVLASSPF